jgi:chemotaxis protein histidine kinase CheA
MTKSTKTTQRTVRKAPKTAARSNPKGAAFKAPIKNKTVRIPAEVIDRIGQLRQEIARRALQVALLETRVKKLCERADKLTLPGMEFQGVFAHGSSKYLDAKKLEAYLTPRQIARCYTKTSFTTLSIDPVGDKARRAARAIKQQMKELRGSKDNEQD